MASLPVNRTTLSVALVLPCAALMWMLTVPGTIGPLTYAVVATLLLATAAISLNTWTDGQPTGSMAPLIHGRLRALLVLSAALTAVLLYGWIA